MSGTAQQDFVDQVRYALRHIYDPLSLAESPLHKALLLGGEPHPYAALQAALLSAIDDLEPKQGVPRESAAWRIHHLLFERYVEQIPLDDIALDLTIGMRQLRRLNAEAVQSLADILWAKHSPRGQTIPPSPAAATEKPLAMDSATWELVVEGLGQTDPIQRIPLSELLDSVLDTVEPLIAQENTRIERLYGMRPLPSVAVQLPATRHALIGLISVGVRLAAGGVLAIDVAATAYEAMVRIEPRGSAKSYKWSTEFRENLAVAQEILALSSASHQVHEDSRGFLVGIDVRLPLAQRVPVLVVDDNLDWLRLYQRCLADSRYRFIGVADSELAVPTAQEQKPQVVILDLMFQESDGWVLLGRLRALPVMADVPIIICTILPHKDLALALGAADLIRKPFTQESLLRVLDQQVFAEAQRSH